MRKILLAIDGSDHSNRATRVPGELSAGLHIPGDVIIVVSDTSLVTAGLIREYARIEGIVISQRELLQARALTSSFKQPTQCVKPGARWEPPMLLPVRRLTKSSATPSGETPTASSWAPRLGRCGRFVHGQHLPQGGPPHRAHASDHRKGRRLFRCRLDHARIPGVSEPSDSPSCGPTNTGMP